ncbi:MAG: shikimate kinase [Rhodothermales bacterium]|nr:shikimate kinase [Rhodothermales bacterium]
MDKSRIYLTGFMGSGKSTIGAMLAQRFGYDFLDLDQNIETVTGRSIPDIFQSHGEAGFREIEKHALTSTAARSRVVIATGGGTIASSNAVYFVQHHGVGVYLVVDEAELTRRLSSSADRPLLFGRQSLTEYVSTKLAERKEFYESMHVRIVTDGLTPDQIVDRLENEIAL